MHGRIQGLSEEQLLIDDGGGGHNLIIILLSEFLMQLGSETTAHPSTSVQVLDRLTFILSYYKILSIIILI